MVFNSYITFTYIKLLCYFLLNNRLHFEVAMASIEQDGVGSTTTQTDEEVIKTVTEKAVSEAQSLEGTEDFLVLVTGVMKKLLGRGMALNQTHTWEGRFIAEPSTLGEGVGAFVHQGSPTLGALQVVVGSKAAVIYATFDRALPQLGWLLAWHKPENPSDSSKVYVEAGHLSNLEKMEWSEVLEKLNASNSKSHYFDKDTGAIANAEIVDHGDKLALLTSSFDQLIPSSD